MVTRRLLPFAILPVVALPCAAGQAATVPTSPAEPRSCGDPGGSFIACEALQDMLPLAAASRCPLCGGMHRLVGGR